MIRKIGVMFLSIVICVGTVASAFAMEYKEAPMLRVKVAAGELPPVEERLPQEPLIVKPIEEIGRYGGVWRMVHEGSSDIAQCAYHLNEHLVCWSADFKQFLPNVAKSWELSEDAKSITFYLRKGIKWSDGAPFTADDVMFWYEAIILNDDINPTKPSWLKREGKLGVVEKIDDYTVRFSFAAPYATVLEQFAGTWNIPYAPKHYLKQFHPTYTSMDKIKKMMREEGYTVFADFFDAKSKKFDTPECPQIDDWIPLNTIDQPVHILVRNPYYWKVDTQGNQLPYVDRIERTLIPSDEMVLLKVIAGDVDFQFRRLMRTGLGDYPVIMENREKGDYRIIQQVSRGYNTGAIWFNFANKDPVLHELYNNKRFRIALSLAINRNEISKLLYMGMAVPAQPYPGPGTPWYVEEYSKAYTEYNPKKANEILDEIGLAKRDKNGFRLRPDGKRLRSVIKILSSMPDIAELIKGYWKDIGIEIVIKPTDVGLWVANLNARDYDLTMHNVGMGWGGMSPEARGMTYPVQQSSWWATAWGLWYSTSGKAGEEPPDEAKCLLEIYKKLPGELSSQKRIELNKEAMRIHSENLWIIGTCRNPDQLTIAVAKNNFRNMLETPPQSMENLSPYSCQYFFKK